ncbi:MAG: hypothetical protein AAF456_03705 [Planctomycetota bacterium]
MSRSNGIWFREPLLAAVALLVLVATSTVHAQSESAEPPEAVEQESSESQRQWWNGEDGPNVDSAQSEDDRDESAQDEAVQGEHAQDDAEQEDTPTEDAAQSDQDAAQSDENAGSYEFSRPETGPFYRVVLRMDQRTHASLSLNGFAKSKVPEAQEGRVGIVRLISPNALVDRTIDFAAEMTVEEGVLTIKVTDEMMHQLEFQSIEINTAQYGFDSILLEAQPGALDRELELELDGEVGGDAPELFVQVSASRGIMARVRNRTTLDVQTSVGEVEIPLGEILALNFDIDGNGTLLVVLKDGSRLTGQTTLRELEIVTRRGLHTVPLEEVTGFTHQDGARFEVIVQDSTAFYRLLPPGQNTTSDPR